MAIFLKQIADRSVFHVFSLHLVAADMKTEHSFPSSDCESYFSEGFFPKIKNISMYQLKGKWTDLGNS
jgi:hypothetical protein